LSAAKRPAGPVGPHVLRQAVFRQKRLVGDEMRLEGGRIAEQVDRFGLQRRQHRIEPHGAQRGETGP
jgi:hypothetical protein